MCKLTSVALRSLIILCVTVTVGAGLRECQRSGHLANLDREMLWAPSLPVNEEVTEHGWPIAWCLQHTTYRKWEQHPAKIWYTVLWLPLVFDVVVWLLILAATIQTTCSVFVGRRGFYAVKLLAPILAVSVLSFWGWLEYQDTYVPESPAATILLQDAPTTPLLRVLDCPIWASASVLFGLLCTVLQLNTYLGYVSILVGKCVVRSPACGRNT